MLTSIRGLVAATLMAGCGLAATQAYADEAAPPPAVTITGSAAIVSQYRFRGLAQSDNKPAVQAAITLSHKSGFYVSAWGSSASAGNGPINIYPGAPLGNYYEIYGSVAKTFGPVTAKVGVYVAPGQEVFNYNWTSSARHNTYVYGELSGGIPNTPITLHGHLGHTSGGFEWGKKYLDYNAGASVKWRALTFDVSVVGTNISKTDIANGFSSYISGFCGTPGTAACNAGQVDYWHRMNKTTVVASLTASF
jgi:Bacterial protein of unknown function (Gcw_chp)